MAWLEITLPTAGRDTEAVAEALSARGFGELVIEDEAEFSEFLESSRAYWDYIDEGLQRELKGLARIRLYLDSADAAALERLRRACGELGLEMAISPLPDTDWAESWKASYPPQEIGRSLVVLPYWRAGEETGRRKIILDPGLTFGTGAHPSTQMVMEAMERLVRPGCRTLDLGSGSGILSITALRLGASAAVGVDIDPKAEDAARENAAYNGFTAPEFIARTGNVLEDRALMDSLAGKYDLVLVNIVADVIIGLAPALPGFLAEGGSVILSGILDSREAEVHAALTRAGLEITEAHASDVWRCAVCRRAE